MAAVEVLDPWEQFMSPVWGWGYWEQWGQALVGWEKPVLLAFGAGNGTGEAEGGSQLGGAEVAPSARPLAGGSGQGILGAAAPRVSRGLAGRGFGAGSRGASQGRRLLLLHAGRIPAPFPERPLRHSLTWAMAAGGGGTNLPWTPSLWHHGDALLGNPDLK